MDSMSGCDIRLVFTFPPKDSTKNAYTSEITFLALLPCFKLLSDIDIRIFKTENSVLESFRQSFKGNSRKTSLHSTAYTFKPKVFNDASSLPQI